MRRIGLLLSLIGLLGLTGCEPKPEDTSDVQVDGSADTGSGGCEFQSDCGDEEICVQSECRAAPTCKKPSDWKGCVSTIEEMESGLGKRAYCDGEYCRVGCMLDRHCPEGELCTDFGSCKPFEGSLDANPPGGESRDGFRAGVAESLMQFPIGLSLGGYGSRAESDPDGRYVDSLRATHGQMHGLYARALALDNGARKLLMVRLPIIFSTSALHEAVAQRLQSEIGGNWRGSLLISSTHTHSGPARFYHLPRETFLPLGMLGIGAFHDQAFEWLVDSAVSAAKEALDDLEPAQIGTEIVEGFDTDDAISSDRRSETPQFDDNRLLIMRIDDDTGTPRAVAVSFGTHGTIHSEDYFNGDALSAVEHGLERALAEKYDRPIPVLYFNQNGGSMSPRGDGRGHDATQRFEKLGHAFAERTIDDIDAMQTKSSVALEGVTYRFPITYELVGYSTGEWASPSISVGEGSFYHGAFRCAGDGDSDYSTAEQPDSLNCTPIRFLMYHRPPTLFLRSQMSAFRIGDLRLVTLPGELTMELSWNILHRLREDHGLDPAETWTLGFAQDHQFYLNPTSMPDAEVSFEGFEGTQPSDAPDGAFSYLQGGYESDMSFWGWKFGDYLTARASDTVARLENENVERKLPEVLPTEYSSYGREFDPIEKTSSEDVGTAVDEPPQTVERFETVEYAWIGGDPGAEMPQAPRVALQKKTGNGFETIQTDSKRDYTNREPVMLTRLRKSDGSWEWVVRWEEGRDLETGTYRFAVGGSYKSDSGIEPYETKSREFEVVVSDDLAVDATGSGNQIEGTIGYPAGEKLKYEGTDNDPGAVTGNFRLRDPRVPTGTPAPLEVGAELSPGDVEIVFEKGGSKVDTVTGSDITLNSVTRDRGGKSDVPTTTFSASAPSSLTSGTTYQVTVRATDTYGNLGETTFSYQAGN